MLRLLANAVERLDSRYQDQPPFEGLKARLLAAFAVIVVVFVPLNLGKVLLVQPPMLPLRFAFNFDFLLAALFCLHALFRGRALLAGNGFVLITLVPIHAVALLARDLPQPVGAAIQLFVFDFVILLLAIVFASRRVAFGALVFIALTQMGFHAIHLSGDRIPGSLAYAAGTLLRDGLISMAFVFGLGTTVIAMIAAAHRRSDETARAARAVNENLTRLVADRTRELEAATARANEASHAKGEFLANMSHEIRTPLHGIIAAADLLQHRGDLPATAAEQARIIVDSGDILMKLIGDILDLSKIEAGRFALETHAFELRPLVEDLVTLVRPRAAAGGVRAELVVDPALPAVVSGDSFRLRQVLLNLVSNAIKFTPSGGVVTLRVTAAAEAGPASVRFAVTDTGIGLDAAALARLFERFAQAETSTTRLYGGTGLGLAISLRLVELMGGRLEAESSPGRGSTFHFTVPLAESRDRPARTAEPEEAPPDLGLHALIAEDNPINRRVLGAQLARLGCRTTMTTDGEEALAALSEEPLPDLVLMDCNMPRLDGWEATRRIRAWATDPAATAVQQRAASLPIIALTAATMPEDRTRCFAAGMTDYLAKPIKLPALRHALEGARK